MSTATATADADPTGFGVVRLTPEQIDALRPTIECSEASHAYKHALSVLARVAQPPVCPAAVAAPGASHARRGVGVGVPARPPPPRGHRNQGQGQGQGQAQGRPWPDRHQRWQHTGAGPGGAGPRGGGGGAPPRERKAILGHGGAGERALTAALNKLSRRNFPQILQAVVALVQAPVGTGAVDDKEAGAITVPAAVAALLAKSAGDGGAYAAVYARMLLDAAQHLPEATAGRWCAAVGAQVGAVLADLWPRLRAAAVALAAFGTGSVCDTSDRYDAYCAALRGKRETLGALRTAACVCSAAPAVPRLAACLPPDVVVGAVVGALEAALREAHAADAAAAADSEGPSAAEAEAMTVLCLEAAEQVAVAAADGGAASSSVAQRLRTAVRASLSDILQGSRCLAASARCRFKALDIAGVDVPSLGPAPGTNTQRAPLQPLLRPQQQPSLRQDGPRGGPQCGMRGERPLQQRHQGAGPGAGYPRHHPGGQQQRPAAAAPGYGAPARAPAPARPLTQGPVTRGQAPAAGGQAQPWQGTWRGQWSGRIDAPAAAAASAPGRGGR